MKPANLLGWTFLLAACTSAPRAAANAGGIDAIRSAWAAGGEAADLDALLTQLDAIDAECRNDAGYQALRGEITFALATRMRAAGRKGTALLLADASSALAKAVTLDGGPTAPRLLLARAQCEGGDWPAAVGTASALVLDLRARPAADADLTAAHAIRARAASLAWAAPDIESTAGAPALLATARASFAALEQIGALDFELRSLWSATEARAGEAVLAVDVYARALRAQPGDLALLDRLVATAAVEQQLPRALAFLSARTDATGRFYLGRVHYLLAAAARTAGDQAAALASFDEASRFFAASMQDNDAYRDSCERWLALCLGSKGNLAFATGDLDRAEASLLAALRSRPDCIGVDLGGGETVKVGLLRLGARIMRDFARTEALFRAAAEAAPADVDLLNNAAIYARDRGTELLRAGDRAAATAMFERSYSTYLRAVQIEPHSVRLRNDCALVAIHHLQGDWERSRQLLLDAIADGEAMQRAAPVAEGESEDLDEAIGDCYENLALWHLEHDRDAAAAKAAAAQSILHRPFAQRGGAQRHLEDAERMMTGK